MPQHKTSIFEKNSARIKQVEEICRQGHPRPKVGPLVYNLQKDCKTYECPAQVLHQYNVSFCFMHKVASTTFQSHFAKLSGFRNLSKSEIQFVGHRLPRYSIKALLIKPLVHSYKVLFVRHPFSRLVSAYHAKLVIECHNLIDKKPGPLCWITDHIKKTYRPKGKSGPVTFKEFVWYLIDNNNTAFDSHWSRVWNVCQPCAVHYDFIGKLETSEEDMDFLYRKLKLHRIIKSTNITMNRSWSDKMVGECFGQLSRGEFSNLCEIYERDLEMFDYSVDYFRQYVR